MGFRARVLSWFLTPAEVEAQSRIAKTVQMMKEELKYREMSTLGVHDGEKYNPILAFFTWYGAQSRDPALDDYTDKQLQEWIKKGTKALYTRADLRRMVQ